MVAVRIDSDESMDRVVSVMRNNGVADLERAEGEWRDGAWVWVPGQWISGSVRPMPQPMSKTRSCGCSRPMRTK